VKEMVLQNIPLPLHPEIPKPLWYELRAIEESKNDDL